MQLLDNYYDRFCPTHFKSMYGKTLPQWGLNYIIKLQLAKGIEIFKFYVIMIKMFLGDKK